MKKNLLLAVALFASVAMSAQTVTWTCEAPSSDGKNIDGTAPLSATVEGSSTITASDVTYGTGVLAPTTCQKSYKDAAGTSYPYCADGYAIIKWVPTVASDAAIKALDEAETAGQYVEFLVEESDETKYIELSDITFDAVRLGTDAVRLNVKLIANCDEGEYDSGWLINASNWETISGGVGSWTEDDGAEGAIPGYQPSREAGDKPNSSATDGCSHITIAKPADFPASAYDLTLHVCFYGIGNNKAVAFHNVKFNLGSSTGISEITTNTVDNVNAPAYNIAGQRVSKDAKGLVIINGKKYLNK